MRSFGKPVSLAAVLVVSFVVDAMATSPSPSQSTVPCGITLVGSTAGVPDVRGEFTIVVRDAGGAPIAGSVVVLDFSACTPDIRVCSIQTWPGTQQDCSGPVGAITVTTDGSGSVTTRIRGGANNVAEHTPGAGFQCAVVSADGIELGRVNVAVFDQNGNGGVNPVDHSQYLNDFWDYWDDPSRYRGRSDFNCTGSINPADHSWMHSAVLGGGSTTSCTAYCH